MDKQVLIDINNKISEQDEIYISILHKIQQNETRLTKNKRDQEILVENEKSVVWSNSSFKNNDQRNSELVRILSRNEKYVSLELEINELIEVIKMFKIDLEEVKAFKNYWKRMFDIEMMFQSNQER